MVEPKRGQASIEYLTTYGWAILIIIIVLAALIWLGVFNPTERVPSTCTLEPGLECESLRLNGGTSGSGRVVLSQVRFTNHLSEPIKWCGIECRTGNNPQNIRSSCYDTNYLPIASGETANINWPGTLDFSSYSSTPMLFTLIEYGAIWNIIYTLTAMQCKQGDTNSVSGLAQ